VESPTRIPICTCSTRPTSARSGRAAASLTPDRTWFIVASKSGGTVEVASMERFFWHRMSRRSAAGGPPVRRHHGPRYGARRAGGARGYRETFVNPADIGGRFSALSLFGLVPARSSVHQIADLLAAGTAMAEGCRQENHANAGLELGAFIGAAALDGRDKLTVVLPPSLAALGLWIEQLVAESTGKHGKGALPVVDEPLGRRRLYGQDRAFVVLSTERDAPDADTAALADLATAGHPILRLSTRSDGLGAEFFRWEFATAVAGAALGINPFDEPNVSEAKEKTRRC
jgi:glucose-6-phosphate isomerase